MKLTDTIHQVRSKVFLFITSLGVSEFIYSKSVGLFEGEFLFRLLTRFLSHLLGLFQVHETLTNARKRQLLASGAVLLFLNSVLIGQVFVPSEEKNYQSLLGEVHLLTLFVDTDKDYWSTEEMESYYKELLKSQTWLMEQGLIYQQELSFENDYFYKNQSVIYLNNVEWGKPVRLLPAVLDELNYQNFDDFLQSNNFDFREKKLKILLFVKDADRSHAYNYWSNQEVDIAVVFCRSTYGFRTDQYVISHEILHQFGAWDLYSGESQSLEKAMKALQLYPNSIMISTSKNKVELKVDELTAWRIGWHHTYKKEYGELKPQRVQKPRRGRTSIKFDLARKKKKQNRD